MNSPPFLVSFSDTRALSYALGAELRELYGAEIERLINLRLPPAVSTRVLSILFGYSVEFCGALARFPETYYRKFEIPKGSGTRQICAPRVSLKVIQKWLGTHLALVAPVDDIAHGFVPGRSAYSGARMHCNARWVYSTDIRDFFPSISRARVHDCLTGLGYDDQAAWLIAGLCCYRDGLAQGSPASPVLSNLVFHGIDRQLRGLAVNHGVRVTRYADDIVFSGLGDFPASLPVEVRALIRAAGFEISAEKDQVSIPPNRLKVYGLVVHGGRPRLTKGYRKKLRAMRHLLALGKVREEDKPRFRGHVSFADYVEGANAAI